VSKIINSVTSGYLFFQKKMKTTQTFSILIWANKAKETKDGLPLFARVTVDGKRIEISLKKKVPSDLWDGKAGVVTGSGENVKFLNNYIAQVKAELLFLFRSKTYHEEGFNCGSSIYRKYR
jgi:integrase/recombinase XerD